MNDGLLELKFRYLNPVIQSEIGVSPDNRLQSIGVNHLWLNFIDDKI